jgi:hypothetical protein
LLGDDIDHMYMMSDPLVTNALGMVI